MQDGSPVIDLSELCRVYPAAATYDGQAELTGFDKATQVAVAAKDARIASLEADKAELRRDLERERAESLERSDRERDERDRLLVLLERQAETVKLLTGQRPTSPDPATVKRSLWGRLAGR